MMERIWRSGEISVRDVHAEFANRLAYTTVMTTMDRLYKKGMLQRRKVGKAFLYVAAIDEQEYRERLPIICLAWCCMMAKTAKRFFQIS